MNRPSLSVRSSFLSVLGVAGALVSIGCTAAPAAPIPADAGNPVAGSKAVRPVATARCVTIERGVNGDVKDARIASSWPDRNYGDLATAHAGTVSGKERLALFKFDLAGIPAAAKVVRAKLTLHRASVSEAPFTVHRAEVAWDEKAVTWSSFDGAYGLRAEATMWAHADGSNVATADITPLVRAWVDGASPNNGIVLRPGAEGGPLSLGSFFTSEAANASDRPRLEVCFSTVEDPAAVL